ncbi:mitochondrial import inner membrane translocase subunit Tim9 [Candida tropicalis MYA-3404]|uniref:Mitochondrial import inner membrane translocase subunit n=1 Tax=Candida tropicalis (strain ATCC MYA-3404 / T1) TaxID=294747 RepID=C5MGD1_CANTT|nr:mitochondrial import inner membrane translocase subunit Tim9 [Candida tropicalis MYA-3404]EER31394.1 mitochondrial import inner membrane translocase subunit Tim9 [Candida tropicalis MYA-3404]MCP8716512.1 Tim10/DDP family zinc finger protein [Asgard group archaeon]
MDQLNVKEQQEFQQIVEQKQMKDFMNLYSNLVSRCFDDCVNDFTSGNLTSKETSCIAKCSEKFLKHSERIGQRFQEQKYVSLDMLRYSLFSLTKVLTFLLALY